MSRSGIERPNGKLYRPRKDITAEEFQDAYGDTGIVVLRTHDIEDARSRYPELLAVHDLQDAEGVRDWWRLVPWDAGSGHDRSYISDPVRGVPCVVFEAS